MLQLCIPFIMAGVTIILYYALYVVCAILDWIALDVLSLGLYIFDDAMGFLNLFDSDVPTASWVVAGIIWLALTVYSEMIISED